MERYIFPGLGLLLLILLTISSTTEAAAKAKSMKNGQSVKTWLRSLRAKRWDNHNGIDLSFAFSDNLLSPTYVGNRQTMARDHTDWKMQFRERLAKIIQFMIQHPILIFHVKEGDMVRSLKLIFCDLINKNPHWD